ncbi:MAG: hypothetical protein PHQ32_06430 [Firmicutes bacterium]|nr:hypothetical protein [Bacillota bacterium]
MKKIKNILKNSSMILTTTILLGAVLMPPNLVKASANWWWNQHYPSQAPGAYVCKVGATSNGSPVRAQLKGVSTSTRQWVKSIGPYQTAPIASYTPGTLDIWSAVGSYSY